MDNQSLANFGRKGAKYLRYQHFTITVNIFSQSLKSLDVAMTLDESGAKFVWRGRFCRR
jgi:hypothetical protein